MQSRHQNLGPMPQPSPLWAGRFTGSNSESLDLYIKTTHLYQDHPPISRPPTERFVVQYRLTPLMIATRYLHRCVSMYNCKLDPVVLWTVKYAYRC